MLICSQPQVHGGIDDTLHREAEDALRAREEQFRLAMSCGELATWDWDVSTGRVVWSDEHYIMHGYAVGEVEPSYEAWVSRVHPDDRAAAEAALVSARDARARYSHVFRVRFPGGEVRWHSAQGRFFYDDRGAAVRMIGVLRDVTDQRNAIDALRQNEERQTFLLGLSDALGPLTAAADVKNTACVLLGRHLRAHRVNYFDIVGDEFVGAVGYADGVAPLTRGRVAEFGAVWRREFRDNELIAADDVQADGRFSDAERAHLVAAGIAAFIVVVQVRDGQRVAGLTVHHEQPRRWLRAEVELVREVAIRVRDAAERGCAEAALRASEAKYRVLFERMTQGCGLLELIRDPAGRAVDCRVLELNPAFERHTGMPLAAAVGRTVYEVVPVLEPSLLDAFERLIATGEPIRFEHHSTGLGRWFDCNAYPRGGDRFALLFEDISERKRREQTQAVLAAITDELVGLDNIADTLRRVSERIARHFGVKHCMFAEHARGFETAVTVSGWTAVGDASLDGTYRIGDYLTDPAIATLRRGEPLVVRDALSDPRVRGESYRAIGVGSFIVIPLVREQRWQFQASISHDQPRVWRAAEVELLQEMVARIWTRVERALAEEALRSSENWLAGQKEAFQAAAQGAPLAVSLGVLVRTVVAQSGDGTRCAFYLADPAGAELRHVVGMPDSYARGVDGFPVGPNSPACRLAMHQGQPVITPDVAADPLWAPWLPLTEQTGFRACWSFPIETISGKMVGTFAMYHREPLDATPRDLGVAAVVTRAAAILISRSQEADERARVEAALRAAEERLRQALAAARMGTWTWDMATDEHCRDANLNALLGLPPEVTVQPLADLLGRTHPDDRDMVARSFDRSARQGRPMSVEFRVLRPDGATRWLRDQGDVFGAAGQARLTGACVDVTDLKEAEAALRRANNELEGRVAERTAELARALASLAAEMERRRILARRLGTAQEDERRRVARDLHDSVGQLMAGLAMALKSVEHAGPLPPQVAARLAETQALSIALGKEVHALAVRLRPTSLDDIGLEAALSGLIAEWSGRTRVKASFHAPGGEASRLPPEVETTIYRVVQEALTNVARHARASTAGVIVRRPEGCVSVVIEDDGVGFDPGLATDRLGLMGMRERVDLVGGDLEVEASPGGGTTLIVTIPLVRGGLA